MSFSARVKEELSHQLSKARHCQIAELAAILSLCGKIHIDEEDHFSIRIHTENVAVARKYFTLLKNTFNIKADISIRRNAFLKKSRSYTLLVRDHENALRVLEAVKMVDAQGNVGENLSVVRNLVIQNACCKKAFIRGAFLAAGSLSDPEKFYHFEIVCASLEKAVQLQNVILTFDIDAKIVVRKKYYVVYIKEGSQIVELLGLMEAHVALMELENIRILKEMRNSVNRQVNCETANLQKAVDAAVRQLHDIEVLRWQKGGLAALPDRLRETAEARLEEPGASIVELGDMLGVSKSGVNHRLRKLHALAAAIEKEEGKEKEKEGDHTV